MNEAACTPCCCAVRGPRLQVATLPRLRVLRLRRCWAVTAVGTRALCKVIVRACAALRKVPWRSSLSIGGMGGPPGSIPLPVIIAAPVLQGAGSGTLQALDAGHTNLQDDAVVHIAQLPALVALRLSQTFVRDEGVRVSVVGGWWAVRGLLRLGAQLWHAGATGRA